MNGRARSRQKPGSLIGGGTNALFAAGLLVPGTFATTGFALEALVPSQKPPHAPEPNRFK